MVKSDVFTRVLFILKKFAFRGITFDQYNAMDLTFKSPKNKMLSILLSLL